MKVTQFDCIEAEERINFCIYCARRKYCTRRHSIYKLGDCLAWNPQITLIKAIAAGEE